MSNWIRKADALRIIRDLYNLSLQLPDYFLTSKFLLLTTAIEVYHRTVSDAGYIDKKIYENSIVPQLLKAIPEKIESVDEKVLKEFREAFSQKLKHLYEYSFNKRLKLLASEYKDSIKFYISNPKDVVSNIADYRNHLTHFGNGGKKIKIEARKLVKYSEIVKFMLELCFLKEMGMSSNRIHQLVVRNPIYQNKFDKWNGISAKQKKNVVVK